MEERNKADTPKPELCLHCGGEPELYRTTMFLEGWWAVRCNGCGARGGIRQHEEKAVEAWNRRA